MDIDTSLAPIGDFSCIQEPGRPRIKARVFSMWSIPFNQDNPSSICLEMILLDRLGSKIQASVCRKHPLIQALMTGRVYIFSRFRVIPNDGVKFTTHQFKLFFHPCTDIVQTYDVRIPRNGWSFLNTQQIRAQRDNIDHLIDCVGFLAAASDVRLFIRNGRMTKMMAIELQDTWGRIGCVVIGNLVDQLADYLAEDWTERPVVVFQFVRIQSFNDKTLMESTPSASKLHINMDIDEVFSLTIRMCELGINYNGPVRFIRLNEPSKNLREDFIENNPKKTISELNDTSKGETFIVHGAIVAVLMDGPWYYPSCRCYSELRANGVKYDCLRCCRTIGKMKNRFRFKIEVFDGEDSTMFLLFDREAEVLTGFSCEELMNSIELEKKVIPDGDYPVDIEKRLAGQEMLFKVCNRGGAKYDRDDCFHVQRICTDIDIIAMFHEHDVLATPKQAKFSPPFSELDITVEDGEVRLDMTAEKKHVDRSNVKEKRAYPMRRKLVIDFESDEEDVGGYAGMDLGTALKHNPPTDVACDADGGTKIEAMQAVLKSSPDSALNAAVIYATKSDMAGAGMTKKKKKGMVAVKTEPNVDAGTSHIAGGSKSGLKSFSLFGDAAADAELTAHGFHGTEADMAGAEKTRKKNKGLVAVKIEPNADAAAAHHVDTGSKRGLKAFSLFEEGSMEAPLMINPTKEATRIVVSHVEVEEVLNKIADDPLIIVISDDEDDAEDDAGA